MNKRLKLMLEQELSNELHELGFSNSIKGFDYIRYAIIKSVECPKYLDNMMNVYKDIATNFEDTYTRVERAIRYSIKHALNRCDKTKLSERFKYAIASSGKICNSEFISTLADNYSFKYKLMLLDENNENMSEPVEV